MKANFCVRLWNSILPSRQSHWRISLRVCRSVVVLRPSGIRRLWWLAWGDLWELLSLTLCWIWLLSRVTSHSNATPALSPSYWRQPEKEILNQDLLFLSAPLNNWELKMSCHMPFSYALAACCIFKVISLVTTNVNTLKTMQETTRPFDERYATVFGKWKARHSIKTPPVPFDQGTAPRCRGLGRRCFLVCDPIVREPDAIFA